MRHERNPTARNEGKKKKEEERTEKTLMKGFGLYEIREAKHESRALFWIQTTRTAKEAILSKRGS